MKDKEKQEKQRANTVIIEGPDQHLKMTTVIINKPIPQPKPQDGES